MGVSRKIQPIIVTPRCLRICPPDYRLLDASSDALPVDEARALRIQIEPDSRRLADQILLGDETPAATVFAVVAVVADHEVFARGYRVHGIIVHVRAGLGRRLHTD